MENREIIKTLRIATSKSKNSYWNTFSRYVQILDNYLDNKSLSHIEKYNHQHNSPRKYYLDLLVKGFELEVDYESPLFEDRLNTQHETLFWTDDTTFYERFFRRLAHFKANNLPINEETLQEMVKAGSLFFDDKYKYYTDPLSKRK